MGDWDVLYHWFECPDRETAHRLARRLGAPLAYPPWGHAAWNEGWGLTFGWISPTLLQAATTRKWGIEAGFHAWATEGLPGVTVTMCALSGIAEYPTCTGLHRVIGTPRQFRCDWTCCFVLGRHQEEVPSEAVLAQRDLTPLCAWDRLGARPDRIAGRPALRLHEALPFQPFVETEWPADRRRSHLVGFYQELLARLGDLLGPLAADERSLYLAFGQESEEHGLVNLGYLWFSAGGNLTEPFYEVHPGGSLNPLRRQVWEGPRPCFDGPKLDDFGVCPDPFGRPATEAGSP